MSRRPTAGDGFARTTALFEKVPTKVSFTNHTSVSEGRIWRKPFFDGLVAFITSSPVVALVVEGENAVLTMRNTLMGATNPQEAATGTIRGDYGMTIGMNLIHGSDSAESAEREIDIFFHAEEILNYQRVLDAWIIES